MICRMCWDLNKSVSAYRRVGVRACRRLPFGPRRGKAGRFAYVASSTNPAGTDLSPTRPAVASVRILLALLADNGTRTEIAA